MEIEFRLAHKVFLIIKDNGVGFNLEEGSGGFGLQGVSERVEVLGGRFAVNTQEGGGEKSVTILLLQLPVI